MKVKIKRWEQMEKEFGLTSVGDIKCTSIFLIEMEDELPDDRIIEVIHSCGDGYVWIKGNDDWYAISNDMIEEVIEK
jgi:hypothetical protein